MIALANRIRIGAQFGKFVGPTRHFRGNVDGFLDNALVGWVANRKDHKTSLKVGAYSAFGLVAEGNADLFRNDLAQAGIGHGRHGFSITLDPTAMRLIREAGGRVTLRTQGPVAFEIGTYVFADASGGDAPAPTPTTAAATDTLQSLLYADLQYLESVLDTARKAPVRKRADLKKHAALFAQKDYFNDSALPGTITAYAEYVRYRYKIDQSINLEDDPENAAHFLQWYLAGYSTLREGLRVPMSRDMLDAFNSFVVMGGQPVSLTHATWSFLLGTPPLLQSMDFHNPHWVSWVVYWWSINQAKSLNCEDCLVPQAYIDRLKAIPEDHADQSFAPSEFMLRLKDEHSVLQGLDLNQTEGRKELALSIVLMAARRPDYLRYLPSETIETLLAPEAEGRTSAFSRFVSTLSEDRVPVQLDRAAYAAVLRLRGFDLDSMAFENFTADGHRLQAARMVPLPDTPAVDVQMIGPFEKASGLGQATRLSAGIMRHTGYSVNSVDFGLDNPAPEGFSTVGELSEYKSARVNILHLNAESIPLAFAYQPDVFSDAYNIGYFFWELDSPAACHHLGMDLLDEIWVSTEYGVQIYQPHSDKPVSNVGMCFEDLPDIKLEDAREFVTTRFGLTGEEFVFLVAFDSFSFVQRKNPIGTLSAFKEAFDGISDVRLIIKTQNRSKVKDPVQQKIWDEVDALIGEDPRIFLLDETLKYSDLLRLKKGSDCYISLHKSEGWGFGMIEAMNLEVPVVATGYSGNMDFCAEDTTWLVKADEVELGQDDYIFVQPGQKWAEPRHESAVAQLRAVYEKDDERAKRAKAALTFVRENFSEKAIAMRYSARLDEILASR